MAIVAYTGLPGSGKSYGVVENVILPAAKEGRPVYTNIPLQQFELIKAYPKADVRAFNIDALAEDPSFVGRFEAGAIVVIDECWRVWPAGMNARTMPQEHKAFFAEHRHNVSDRTGLTTEIVLVTQDLAQLCAFVRQLVEETFRSVKLTALGMENSYRIDVYSGAVTGQRPPKTAFIRSIHGKYQASVYRFYQSHTKSEGGKAGVEKKQDKRGNLLRRPLIMVGLPLCLVVLAYSVHSTMRFFSGESVGASEAAAGVEPIPSPGGPLVSAQAAAAPPVVVEAGPAYSKEWRLTCVVQFSDRAGYACLSTLGVTRRIPLKECEFSPDLLDWQCSLNGRLVTKFTGVIDEPEPGIFDRTPLRGLEPRAPSSADVVSVANARPAERREAAQGGSVSGDGRPSSVRRIPIHADGV